VSKSAWLRALELADMSASFKAGTAEPRPGNPRTPKARGHYRLHFGQGIEPDCQRPAAFALLHAAVELLLNGLGEPSDFAVVGHFHGFFSRIWWDLVG
jgi:hypothetical protein